MKQPMDHLRSKKKPIRKTVWVAGDSEIADELSELEASLSRLEGSLAAMPANSNRREAADLEAARIRDEVHALRGRNKESSIKFVFQAISRRRYDELIDEFPPTEEQIAKHKADGSTDALEFNPDTFPYALIAECTVEPEVDREELAEWLREGDEWNNAEVLTLFMAAMEVNQTRRLITMGKD